MVELRLETIYLLFSSDSDEYKSSYFGHYMKNKFILEHLNYIHRQRLLFSRITFRTLFDGDSNFSKISPKNGGLTYLK